jgi:predicted nuclease with TOPRIM domain
MEPVTTVTTVWTIVKTAGEISKKLYEFQKTLKDRDAKQHVDEILDKVRELKQSASELEDENCELKEKLRFKSDEYQFRTPFWYPKSNPNRPLCVKCFVKNIEAPMSEPREGSVLYRRCLVCDHDEKVGVLPSEIPRAIEPYFDE